MLNIQRNNVMYFAHIYIYQYIWYIKLILIKWAIQVCVVSSCIIICYKVTATCLENRPKVLMFRVCLSSKFYGRQFLLLFRPRQTHVCPSSVPTTQVNPKKYYHNFYHLTIYNSLMLLALLFLWYVYHKIRRGQVTVAVTARTLIEPLGIPHPGRIIAHLKVREHRFNKPSSDLCPAYTA